MKKALILLAIGAVGYVLWKQYGEEEFYNQFPQYRPLPKSMIPGNPEFIGPPAPKAMSGLEVFGA